MDEKESQEEKGFRVSDRRFTAKTTSKEDGAKSSPPSSDQAEQVHTMPPVNFSTFLLSLSSAAMMYFGDIADPVSQQKTKNLALAKQHIDILALLQEKTKGNLTAEEENLLEELLYNLRMRYIQERKKR